MHPAFKTIYYANVLVYIIKDIKNCEGVVILAKFGIYGKISYISTLLNCNKTQMTNNCVNKDISAYSLVKIKVRVI